MMIRPSTVILLIFILTEASAIWPVGQYCLPMPSNERCPVGWERGYRFQTTERRNRVDADRLYVATRGKDLGWGFCCKSRVMFLRAISWPKGNYCIFRKGGFCPPRFMEGSIHWDDKDRGNTNSAEGTLPDGRYDHNTQIYFCCRHDGPRMLTGLPRCSSLILMKFDTCPTVSGYLGPFEQYIDWNTEDLFNNDRAIQAYPDGFSQHPSGTKLEFCTYISSYSC